VNTMQESTASYKILSFSVSVDKVGLFLYYPLILTTAEPGEGLRRRHAKLDQNLKFWSFSHYYILPKKRTESIGSSKKKLLKLGLLTLFAHRGSVTRQILNKGVDAPYTRVFQVSYRVFPKSRVYPVSS